MRPHSRRPRDAALLLGRDARAEGAVHLSAPVVLVIDAPRRGRVLIGKSPGQCSGVFLLVRAELLNVRYWHKADKATAPTFVRFSNGVARGLVLLFGIGARALAIWDSKTRRNNLLGGLAVR